MLAAFLRLDLPENTFPGILRSELSGAEPGGPPSPQRVKEPGQTAKEGHARPRLHKTAGRLCPEKQA